MDIPERFRRHSKLLQCFPKTRKVLPPAYSEIFVDAYKSNREGEGTASSIAIKLEQWMHRMALQQKDFPVLEVGAGSLNHVTFESPDGDYDAVEPMIELYEGKKEISRIRHLYNSMDEIPSDVKYRRIISIAVLEHVLNLPTLLAQSALRLETEGKFTAGIPTEGGLLWYLAWRFGTGSAFRLKYGLSYAPFMRSEHVNHADEILKLVQLFFGNVEIKRYPTPLFHLSFYTTLIATRPNYDAARDFLASESSFGSS